MNFHDVLRERFGSSPPVADIPPEHQDEANRIRDEWSGARRSDMQTIRGDCVAAMPAWKRFLFVEILHGIATNRDENDRVRLRAYQTLRKFLPALEPVCGRRRQRV